MIRQCWINLVCVSTIAASLIRAAAEGCHAMQTSVSRTCCQQQQSQLKMTSFPEGFDDYLAPDNFSLLVRDDEESGN